MNKRILRAMPMRRACLATLATLALAGTASAVAAEFPAGPVTIVVPFPPGGPTDTTARLVGKTLSKQLGQPVVIENRAGAGGTVGSASVARAKPDGHTLLWASTSSLGVAPGLYRNLAYSPMESFAHIGLVARSPILLVVRHAFPANTLQELVAYAAKNKVSYGSAGNGSINHLTGEWFKEVSGANILHVPYKGGAPALADMIGGQIDMTLETITVVRPYLESGRAKVLATGGATRSADMPQVPTVREVFGGDFESYSWTGLVAPAGTPAAVVQKLNAALRAAQDDPELMSQMKAGGQDVIKTTPDEFRSFLASDTKRWAELIKRTNTTLD
ncbi:tripartite tricarboxylate transporter substrate binding protein [Pigmentiphaga sp. GD03639]|uniref:Bug family tripartite tricarboxylate transporter substrate binding protein n=1 Tax=unclassified Pigmentiphaga TaxID=2626614 RepID=UPI00244ACF14|nr:tripartite tricarboxylate transporter substrate binding protein [Pigmentiphaga sp. GD03639]MDH2238647.1 tripartite tricarboxylate transporter substrate binding protein [Pigmentiphaga sp. GD03639]